MTSFLDVSIQRINTLNNKLIPSALRVFNRCQKEGIPIYIVWGKRSFEDQELMFRYGRSIPGSILTTRRGGYSPHNYGLALDFCLVYNTQLLSWEDVYNRNSWKIRWIKVIRYFEEEGWESLWRTYMFEPMHVQNMLDNTILGLYEKENSNRNNRNKNLGK